ncbi:type B 50S ribosomal protein L31 [Candidatus Saccharibacteria bacterium]|nr:type B 50S ribosomal protein L31 [Candidatus Saccharibacteria bacterium]
MSKKELHPKDYRDVVFSDEAAGFSFLTKSTAKSEETIKWEDGNEYPLVKVQISSASHPFFTGEEKIIDTEGRVDRFKARAAKAAKLKDALSNKAKKIAKEAEKKAKAEDKTDADAE